ncbi:tRNA (guanine-N1)-methyltransferase [Parcubacteria bacterium DG_72]|nr:MAG: tRNA (guanine-N1)-methyltransferase [Parcubacteria bacterium DG_72]
MIKFDIITIFPEIFISYFKESLISRAQKKKLIKIKVHNLRKWAKDKHKTVDDRPFGGGFGMVMKVEPIYRAVKQLKKKPTFAKASAGKAKVILFTPRGEKFNQTMAHQFSKLDHIIMICGRYEGVDERVAKKIADIELSIGDYVLMGGEIPAIAVIEATTRLIPGALGKEEMIKQRTTREKGFVEQQQYTRPEVFEAGKKKWRVPKVLLSGDHKKIEDWRKKHKKIIA